MKIGVLKNCSSVQHKVQTDMFKVVRIEILTHNRFDSAITMFQWEVKIVCICRTVRIFSRQFDTGKVRADKKQRTIIANKMQRRNERIYNG